MMKQDVRGYTMTSDKTTYSSEKIACEKNIELLQLSRSGLEAYFQRIGEKTFHARQIFRWIYHHGVLDIKHMTDLPIKLRQRLEETTSITPLMIERHQVSQDGTQKILFRLSDGAKIESVVIPEGKRVTLCISSQVGCALACRFCYTAKMGPGRNLTVSEYMGQFLGASSLLELDQKITNVVFMGMGEPLVNFRNLLDTINILRDELGIAMPSRRITVSTAGLCPEILELGKAFPLRLAISLHATTNAKRNELMPINRRYNLEHLFSTLQVFREIPHNRRYPITLEYTLIEDINDGEADAKRLAKLAHSIHGKVNLIPYNEHAGADYKRPSEKRIRSFHRILQAAHVPSTRRGTRGDDISAACGQLAIQTKRFTPSPQKKHEIASQDKRSPLRSP